ncbi:hypothetical protein GALMADRAFT_228526 [Galerina marginata CBS 339.88]|uniref:DUF6533 domain-containing protein n=1 Tax=Galerina marginata (strain CBS 339.88) TaxID=685588 RepID=A0A067SS07_GALM3|nr:hypothetical protein GALMADRAFT_228526 [Galerina marginata CBS 339.88]
MDPGFIAKHAIGQFSAAKLNLFLWIASYSLVVFDYIFTLDKEVKYVWSCPCSIGLVLFYLNRYLPFIDIILFSQIVLNTSTSSMACSVLARFSAWFIVIGMMISQTIIILRTYAIWGRRKLIFWILAPMTATSFTFALALTLYRTLSPTHSSLNKFETPTTSPQIRCQIAALSVNQQSMITLLVNFMLTLATETVITILTAIKAKEHVQKVSSSWVTQLYRNGFLYCVCMLALTTLNSVFSVVAPPSLKLLFFPLQRALHSIFCNRVILLILQHRNRISDNEDSSPRCRRLSNYAESTMDVFTSIQLDTTDDFESVPVIPWRERARMEWLR